MLADNPDAKTGDVVREALACKHPELRVPDVSVMKERTPDFVEPDIAADAVEKVARGLGGSAGPGGTDPSDSQHWLLQLGGASAEF